MKNCLRTLIICCLTTVNLPANEITTVRFEPVQVAQANELGTVGYPGAEMVQIGQSEPLPGLVRWVRLETGESTESLSINQTLSSQTWPYESKPDQPTSSENQYQHIAKLIPADDALGQNAVYIGDQVTLGDERFVQLILFPVIESENERRAVDQITISVGSRLLTENDLLDQTQLSSIKKREPIPMALATGPQFLILTNQRLASAFKQLADYRNSLGLTTAIELVGDIYSTYSGRDNAEQIRERLKQFYADGGRYVLLGGDETVVPIRYAYHYRTAVDLGLIELQICDLYFADIDGDWNADGDNVWGERYDDDTDLSPELRVGRLPFSDSAEVTSYINKLIAYEIDPGHGKFDYLTRAYFYSSDQMRDYNGGQHNVIASAYPSWFEFDTINGVEAATGADLNPTNPSPHETVDRLADGFGIVNIIAHGRPDGFVVKSSGYGESANRYLLTAPEGETQASTDSLAPNGLTGFYYSLACDNGAIDYERYYHTAPVLVRALLAQKEAGAVGMIAYSRWGWVGSSHLLQKAFFDSLFAHPDQPAIEAFYAAKNQYLVLRDLALGQNFFGDPTMKIYTNRPSVTELSLIRSDDAVVAKVSSDGNPLSGETVRLSQGGVILAAYQTDQNGEAILTELAELTDLYQIAVVKPGYTTGYATYSPSIVTGLDDDLSELPVRFTLGQNYPNPFNPTTAIPFEMPKAGAVQLSVLNILGQEVVTLIDGFMSAGTHQVVWDGRNETGKQVASGVYFYRLSTATETAVKKMLLIE